MVPASGGSAAPAVKTTPAPSTSALIAGMKPNAPAATTTTPVVPSSPLVASMKTGTSSPVTSTTTPDIASMVASTPAPKDTSSLFSDFTGFVSKAASAVGGAINKVITPPTADQLPDGGKSGALNTLAYLPSELARQIPGVAELQDDPTLDEDVAKYVNPSEVASTVPGVLAKTVKAIAAAPIKAVADVYDAGRVFLGKNPDASFNVPGLGTVTSDEFDAATAVQNGTSPIIAALQSGSSSIFNTLFFADLVNRVAAPRGVTVAATEGNLNDIAQGDGTGPRPVVDTGPKSGRLYEPPTAYSKGGAQVLPQQAIDTMQEQGIKLGSNFDPSQPVFFKVTAGRGGAFTGEMIQVKPSYLSTIYSKVFGTSAPTETLPSLLGAKTAVPTEALSTPEMAELIENAPDSSTQVLHSQTVKSSDIVQATNDAIAKAPETPAPAAQKAPVIPSTALTVSHNALRLLKGDTAKAPAAAQLLKTNIQKGLAEHGEAATRTALMENVGVDEPTANKLIQEAGVDTAADPAAILQAMTPVKVEPQPGVPSHEVEGIDQAQPTKLSDEEAAPLAQRAANLYDAQEMMPAIKKGEPIIIGSDNLKDYFGKDYNANNHPVYSQASNELYKRALDVSPSDTVKFTVGGTGSGKSDFLVPGEAAGFNGIIYDSTGWNYDGLKKQIDLAKAAGKKIEVYGIVPDLIRAKAYTHLRELNGEHPVSETAFNRTHAKAIETLIQLVKDGEDVNILDTRNIHTAEQFKDADYVSNPLALLESALYSEEDVKNLTSGVTKENAKEVIANRQSGAPLSPADDRSATKSGKVLTDQANDFSSAKEYENALIAKYGPNARFAPIENVERTEPVLNETTLDKYRQQFKDGRGSDFGILVNEGNTKPFRAVDRNHRLEVLKENGVKYVPIKIEGKEGYVPLRGSEDAETFAQMRFINLNRGFINVSEMAKPVIAVADYIKENEKNATLTGGVEDAIYQHEGARKANRQRAIQLADAVGKQLSAEQWSKLYDHDEDKTVALDAKEQEIYDKVIVPLKTALTTSRAEFRKLGGVVTPDLPQDEYTPRNVVDKGGPIDRLLKMAGRKDNSIKNGSSLSKSVGGGAKHRVYHILTDVDGERTVVAIKDKKVSAINGKVITPMGSLKGKLENGAQFEGKDGKTYTIGQATTKEIEANTSTRYYKNPLAAYIVSYDRQQNALSSLKLLEHIKNDPALGDILVKEEEGSVPPEGWVDLSSITPQFRGYYAEQHLAEMFEDLKNRTQGQPGNALIDGINNFLVSSIVLNPIMHFPNVAIGWAAAQSAIGGTGAPGLTPKSRANFARAFNSVRNKDALYLSYLEHGAPFMGVKQTTKEFTDAILTQYSAEVAKNPAPYEALAKTLGYANPLTLAHGFAKLNESITWGGNDVMFMHALLDYAENTGSTPEEAIKFVSKRMADYRIPSRILGSRTASKFAQSKALLFGRFRFSGVIKPWIDNIKDSADPRSTAKERMAGIRTLAFLGLMAYFVYPYIDKMLKGITGNNNTYLSMAGPLKVVQNIEKAVQAGPEIGIPELIASTAQLNPVLYGMLELGYNTDLYTRNPIYGGHANDESLGTFGVSMVSPLATAERLTASQFALSMFGIYSPKNTSGANALNAQKYDELPALEVQLKKDEAAGLTAKANAEIKDFNDRAIANYNNDQMDKGLPPLQQDQVQSFLKQWGVKAPGAVAMANASALYGDGSLTSKSSLIDRVATYAKAIGTDPLTAFGDIFNGQSIVRVDNAGLFNEDAAVIVQRAPLATTEAVRQSEASAAGISSDALAGMQLDHFIPLEAGGTNETYNLDLITTEQNQVDNAAVETPIAAGLKQGTISRANALEYIVRYKIGTLGEVPNAYYQDLYKNKYGSQPITAAEVVDLINSGKAK